MLTEPVTMVTASSASTADRTRFTPATIRRRSWRSATAPAGTPNSSWGRIWARAAIETSSGSRVSEATSSGPAASATPSPALVTTDDARSQRKLRPSLAGATVSAASANGLATRRRIPSRRQRPV